MGRRAADKIHSARLESGERLGVMGRGEPPDAMLSSRCDLVSVPQGRNSTRASRNALGFSMCGVCPQSAKTSSQ
jgi:hypothetical protein